MQIERNRRAISEQEERAPHGRGRPCGYDEKTRRERELQDREQSANWRKQRPGHNVIRLEGARERARICELMQASGEPEGDERQRHDRGGYRID